MPRAFELERQGNYDAAARAYRELLARKPGDVSALLGLERVLLPLNRGGEILPDVRAALAASPASPAVYGVAMRAWGAAGQPDSMRSVAEAWARVTPRDEAPYREWGAAALAARDRDGAVQAYRLGRERLGRTDVLAAEMAQLAVTDGDFGTAAREWLPGRPEAARLPGDRGGHARSRSARATGRRSFGHSRPTPASRAAVSSPSCGSGGGIRSVGSRRWKRACPSPRMRAPRRCAVSSSSSACSAPTMLSSRRAGRWRRWPGGS